DPEIDAGHFKHRALAGEQIMGMNIDGDYPRTSNFMEHGTLAGRIRQEDCRPFLLALYGNLCYAMDSTNRYAREDALLPGNPAVGVARRASCRPRRAARFGAGGENQGDDRGIVRKSEVRSQKNTEDSFLLSAFCLLPPESRPLNPDP